MHQIERDNSGTGETTRPKAVRRVRVVLAFGVLLVAGLLASGALGMVSITASDTTTDTSSTATETAPTTDTSGGESTTTASSTETTGATTTTAPAATPALNPTIGSDKADYAPGSTVTLTGSGWGSGEAIHLFVNDDIGQAWKLDADVNADAAGTLLYQFQLPNFFIAEYNVTATGADGEIVKASFTDAVQFQFQGKDGAQHPQAAEEDLGTVATGSDVAATCLGIKGTGLGGGQTLGWQVSYVGAFGDNSALAGPSTFTPSGGTLTGNGTDCVTFTVPTSGLPAGTYHGELQVQRTSGALANPEFYYFKFTVTSTMRATSTSIARSSGTNPSVYGDGVTFTATVTASGGNPSGVGTVTFKDGANVLCNAVALSGNAATCSPALAAGSYSLTAEYSGTTSGSPQFGASTSSALGHTVNKANQTINVTTHTPASGTYNSSFAVAANGGGSGNPVTFSSSGACSNNGANFTMTSGSGTCTVKYDQAGDANYNPAPQVSETVNAAKADQAINFGSLPSKTYGDADFAVGATSSSGLPVSFSALGSCTFVLGQVHLTGAATCTITASQAGNDNYNAADAVPQSFTITAKAITVKADDKAKVYGSPDPALTVSVPAGALEQGDSLSGELTREPGKDVGSYAITKGTLTAGANYDLTVTPGTFTITHKPITGSFVAADKTYDGNTDATVTSRALSGLVSGDTVSLDGRSAAFDTKNAGTAKTVTLAGATLSGADAGNYTLDSVATAKANITPKPITVQADDKTKVYGSPDPALTVTVPAGALESGDSLSGSLVRAAGNSVSSYAITKGTLTGGANYDLTVTPGTLTIAAKPITVQADDKTKVYGSLDPELTVTVPAGALESGDSLSGSLVRASGSNVGSYAITKGSLSAGANYDLTVTPGTLTITKKSITVTADDKTKLLGAADPALTYKVTSGSLESGDSFSGALTRAPGEAVGAYAITQGTLTAGVNYDLTFLGSSLKIVYGWDGFLQPINDTAHQTGVQESKFKLGQTIPAKFVLKNAAGAVVQQATAPTFSRSGNLGACDSTATPDTTDAVTPDAGVTYTWDGSQYHYNWSTKGLAAGEYRIYANLADGTKPWVDICLTK
jgi:hypothetical protein